MELDKVRAENFYQDKGDKVKLNWFLYEYANLLYLKISTSSKLVRYKKRHSQDQITAFCVYFSKRLKKSIFDMETGRSKSIVFDAKYVYEFYPDNSFAQTQALLDMTLAAWEDQLKCCSFCPSKCLVDGYEITGMFDSLGKTGWPT
jgi:uncharacterized Fe-S radical SAM superfamily protein PflX